MSPQALSPNLFAGKRALVMGLGIHGGGLGVARFLATHGADVTVTDLRSAELLAEPMARLADLPIRYVLGEHREADFTDSDLVVRNPAVPRESPLLAAARAAGVPIEMEMSLFFRYCPAPIIGVTGTKGKTTTTSLCAAMLTAWRADAVVAGNMGISALEQLDAIAPETPVVIELSSWQLEGLAEYGLSPQIALVTNLSPDHLNRYATMDDYAEAKRGIVRGQSARDVAILNRDDPVVWGFSEATAARVVPYGVRGEGGDEAWLSDERLHWRLGDTQWSAPRASLRLPGEHNAINTLAAGMAALLRGAPFAAIEHGLASFAGVKDRLESLGEVEGVEYINDTTATAPAAAAAALRAMTKPTVLIAGGSEKHTNFAEFAAVAASVPKAIVLLGGDSLERLTRALLDAGLDPARLHRAAESMEEAVWWARGLAAPGDVVLLSPACASFGMFRNEFHRGEMFREAVAGLAGGGRMNEVIGRPSPVVRGEAGMAAPVAGRVARRPARRRSVLALLSTRGMHEPDYGLLVTLAALVVFGTVMIFSATFAIYLPDGGGGTFYFLKKQVGWLLLGGFGFLVMSRIDYHFWRAYSIPALAGALGLLMLVMVPGLGVAGGGAHRWLNLGPVPQFQPSELAKMALILYLADWLTKRGPRLGTWLLGVMPFSVILGGMIFLVMLEPDLGTSFLLAIIGITMLLVAGANLRQFALYLGLGAAAFMVLALGATYRRERLALFMKSDQELYLIDGGWQLIQARLSFGSGGFFGVGLGASRLKYGWLPAAHTDAIFAVIGEELGFIGCVFLLGLFLILAIRGYRIVMRAADPFGALLATGIVSWIVFQAMINLGGITTAIPFTGVPLPFVSYGGTSLCVVMAAAGVLVNISRQTTEVGSGKSEVGRKKRRARAQPVPGKTTIN